MRIMKGSIYRYARKQAYRDFSRAYNQYSRNKNANGKDKPEITDTDITIFISVIVVGFLLLVGITQ